MNYFLYVPHSQAWSEQAYTIEELMLMPEVNDQSILAPAESPEQTLTFAKAKTLHAPQPRRSAPTQHKASDNASRSDSNGERLYTYRMVCGTCQFILYQMIFWNYLLLGLLVNALTIFLVSHINVLLATGLGLVMFILVIIWARRRAAGRVKGIGKESQMDGDPWWWRM